MKMKTTLRTQGSTRPSRKIGQSGRKADRPGRESGLTLLELVIALTILAAFLLPMLLIITNCKVRALKYTFQREMRDLAQRKLFDCIHYVETKSSGDFGPEGHSNWTWVVSEPEMVGNGAQVLLQYRIQVRIPQKLDDSQSNPTSTASASTFPSTSTLGGEGTSYEMQTWTFPDENWYAEQQQLMDSGQISPALGNPMSLGGTGY